MSNKVNEYFQKWLTISARTAEGTEETKSYLHAISKEQEDSFLVFLEELEENKGVYAADMSNDMLLNYISTFTNQNTLEYLDLIGDLFPNIKFTHLHIKFNDIDYGYKNY